MTAFLTTFVTLLISSTVFASQAKYENVYQAGVTMGETRQGCPPSAKCISNDFSVELKITLKACADELISLDYFYVNDVKGGEALIVSAIAGSPSERTESCTGEKVLKIWKMAPGQPKHVVTFDTLNP